MVVVALSALFTACSDEGHWDGYNSHYKLVLFFHNRLKVSFTGL